MSNPEYAHQILSLLQKSPTTLPPIKIDDSRRRNAGRCMTDLACNRLAQGGERPQHLHHTTFEWHGGVIALRNSRVADHFWSTSRDPVLQQIHELAEKQPVVYLLLHWDLDEAALHVWAVPENVAFEAFTKLPPGSRGDEKSVQIGTDDHQLQHAPGAPSFAPYYTRAALTEAEQEKLLEAIKTDDTIKQERLASAEEESDRDIDEPTGIEGATLFDESEDEPTLVLTDETVAFLQELAEHTNDGPWHERNKRRYEHLLRDPSQVIVEELRTRYIQRLNPAVAGGKRHLSILKKNDYGKGGYHDHYWFAFYDPAAGSKTRSVQLFVRFLGGERVWRYGLAMGNYCALPGATSEGDRG